MKPGKLHDKIGGFIKPWKWENGEAFRANERSEVCVKVEDRGGKWTGFLWGRGGWLSGPGPFPTALMAQFAVDQFLLSKNCVLEQPVFLEGLE